MDPDRFLSDPRDEPTEVRFEPAEGATSLYENGLGALETGILLASLAGPDAESGWVGWDGDRYALLEVDGERSLVWYSVWDDEASRDHFMALMDGALDGLGGPAALQELDVEGRPGAYLTVGRAPVLTVRLSGGQP